MPSPCGIDVAAALCQRSNKTIPRRQITKRKIAAQPSRGASQKPEARGSAEETQLKPAEPTQNHPKITKIIPESILNRPRIDSESTQNRPRTCGEPLGTPLRGSPPFPQWTPLGPLGHPKQGQAQDDKNEKGTDKVTKPGSPLRTPPRAFSM